MTKQSILKNYLFIGFKDSGYAHDFMLNLTTDGWFTHEDIVLIGCVEEDLREKIMEIFGGFEYAYIAEITERGYVEWDYKILSEADLKANNMWGKLEDSDE